MKFFLVLKFVIFFISIGQFCLAQERRIRVFEKKNKVSLHEKALNDYVSHLILFPSKDIVFVEIDQNKAWEVNTVNWNEWTELPENTLVVVQAVSEPVSKTYKKQPEPILLGSLTFKDFKTTAEKNLSTYAISWSMDTIYPAETSVQTSRKIETSNCCDKGTCSVLISFEKKTEQVQLLHMR